MKKFAKILYWSVFTLLIIVALFVFISLFNDKITPKILVISSGSMSPSLSSGSIVAVRNVDNYEINDVITFIDPQNHEKSLTHRIVGIEYEDNGSDFYITKGDANKVNDSQKIKKEDVIGKVFMKIPLIGYLVTIVKRPMGLIFLVIIPGIFFVSSELNVIKDEMKKIKERRLKYET